jgi:hypothetical protein
MTTKIFDIGGYEIQLSQLADYPYWKLQRIIYALRSEGFTTCAANAKKQELIYSIECAYIKSGQNEPTTDTVNGVLPESPQATYETSRNEQILESLTAVLKDAELDDDYQVYFCGSPDHPEWALLDTATGEKVASSPYPNIIGNAIDEIFWQEVNDTPAPVVETVKVDCLGNLRRSMVALFVRSGLHERYIMVVDHASGWIVISDKATGVFRGCSQDAEAVERWIIRKSAKLARLARLKQVVASNSLEVLHRKDYPITTGTALTQDITYPASRVIGGFKAAFERYFDGDMLLFPVITLHWSQAA